MFCLNAICVINLHDRAIVMYCKVVLKRLQLKSFKNLFQ